MARIAPLAQVSADKDYQQRRAFTNNPRGLDDMDKRSTKAANVPDNSCASDKGR
jgi:hypothetical protein